MRPLVIERGHSRARCDTIRLFGGATMPYADLREYLAVLEKKGLLCHVTPEVDREWEVSAVCRQTFRTIPQERRPALMFDHIKGSDIPLVVGILGGSRMIYAMALGTDLDGVW